jgi:hypothetical protein
MSVFKGESLSVKMTIAAAALVIWIDRALKWLGRREDVAVAE